MQVAHCGDANTVKREVGIDVGKGSTNNEYPIKQDTGQLRLSPREFLGKVAKEVMKNEDTDPGSGQLSRAHRYGKT